MASAPSAAAGEAARDRALQQEFGNLLNAYRARHGLVPLQPDAALGRAAAGYACTMSRTAHFDHVGPDGSRPADRARAAGFAYCRLAENIAMGYADASAVMQGWIGSPGHRRNMLDAETRVFGIASSGSCPGGAVHAPPQRSLWDFLPPHLRQGREPSGTQAEAAGPAYWVLMLGRERC